MGLFFPLVSITSVVFGPLLMVSRGSLPDIEDRLLVACVDSDLACILFLSWRLVFRSERTIVGDWESGCGNQESRKSLFVAGLLLIL